MEYSILTPIAPHKLYSKQLFWDNIDSLTQQPKQIFLCSKKAVHKYWMQGRTDENIVWCREPDDAVTRLVPGTTTAREMLRKEFIMSGKSEWALWLDCDIISPPDMIDKFEAFYETHPNLIMLRAFHPCRSDVGKVRHGISCTFAHWDTMTAHPFTVATIRGQHFGDDQIWLHIISQFSSRRGLGVFTGLYFDLKHAHEDGRIKEFDRQTKRRLLLP